LQQISNALIKESLKSISKQIVFWLIFFAFARIIFLIYYHKYLTGIDVVSIMAIFWHGLKLDISTICYILAFPFLWLVMQAFFHRNWMNKVVLIYTAIIIFIYSLIATAEIGVFQDWQTKLSAKAVRYLSHPGEVYGSVASSTFFLLLFIMLLQCCAGFFIFRKWFWHKIKKKENKIIISILFFLLMPVFIGFGLRGGFQAIPINQSESYFSKHNFLNLVAVNPGWNMLYSMKQTANSLDRNPFLYFTTAEAEKIVEQIHIVKQDTTVEMLTATHPNIMMVIMEGFSADLVESLGGEKGITPCFHTLEKDGILFTDIYSNGSRSEQGMASIFGGFPATPIAQIARQPEKFIKLSSFPQKLIDNGYYTSFYFGGQLIYGNLKGYIYSNNFDRIKEGYQFDSDLPRGKLGIHDEFVYPEIMKDLNTDKTPFFSAYFTLSSHTPYDIPNFKQNIQWPDLEKEYVNAAFYADSCLGNFISLAKKQSWYKNTLFIIVADHGHSSYKLRGIWSPGYNKIPLLFFGDVIKNEFRGTQNSKTGSQVDIAATLLHQLKIKSNQFVWSKDLLNPTTPGFALYTFEVGFGWVCPEGSIVWDHNMNNTIEVKLPVSKQDSVLKVGKAYLQQVYQQYYDF
jgi:phosphoglycerol transferase MdoB-like AlkP superfamily enzyme